ncbi:MAG: DUF1841 family protein [Burkholderiales bacterium]|nr:DUF1841 family protein [Burkholderiales bacterium]
MFQPSQADVRRFFCRTYAKVYAKPQGGLPLDRMELIAARWIAEHPEYHADLADEAAAVRAAFSVEAGRTNPFLHLSMHLTIEEQCSIDQPTGIRQAVQLLAARRGSLHEAHHEVMECLGEMIWASQRSGLPPDGAAYIEAVRRRATAG